jgi:hypothetical protein
MVSFTFVNKIVETVKNDNNGGIINPNKRCAGEREKELEYHNDVF